MENNETLEQTQEKPQKQQTTEVNHIDYEKILKEKFNVQSIDELIMKLEADEEQRLKEQQKYRELAEKKEKEVSIYKQKFQQTVLRAEVIGKSSGMGFIDPEVVLSLVQNKAVVKDDGNVLIEGKSIDEFLKELAEQKPYLLKATNKQGSGATITEFTASDIQTYEDLLKLPSEKIKEFISKNPERYKQLKQEYFAKKIGG